MPSTTEAVALYRAFLRESAKFPNYNIKEYIRRRAREGFEQAKEMDKSAAETLWKIAKEEMEVVKRQSVVYGLYARKHKNVVELNDAPSS